MATIGACLSQDLRKSALFNHAMFRFNVKSPAKAHTQFMKVPVLLYNGKRQGLTIRTTPPEFGISARLKADTLIGPVQEIRESVLSDNRTVSQTVATLPSTVESLSLFGGQCREPISACPATARQRVPPYEPGDGASVARWKLCKRMSIRTR